MSIERLKNLACGYEGSNAVITLSHVDAHDLLAAVKPDEAETLAGLKADPASIKGKTLCELVERLQAPSVAEIEAVAVVKAEEPETKPEEPKPVEVAPPPPKPVPPAKKK